jgi:electron transfer flavoprotein alpha/beta subunit
MRRVAVVIGFAGPETRAGASTLPMSDRGAVALALSISGADVCAYASDSDACFFARAAGVETVAEISELEMGSVDVALIGRGGCGADGDALPARLAEESDAALVYDVIDLHVESDRLVATRDLGRGARDLLSVRGRAVLVIADSVARGPYVSRFRIDAERTTSGEAPARQDRAVVGWEPVTPRVRLGDHASRVAGRAVERMNALFGVGEVAESAADLVRGSAEECARHLLRYLVHHGFIEPGLDLEDQGGLKKTAVAQRAERKLQAAAVGMVSIPIRVRRRPRSLNDPLPPMRGPFEIGVDL